MFHMEQISNSKKLGSVIKKFMSDCGKTQTQVSIETGIPRNSLNRKLNGGVFDFDELTKVASAIDKPLSFVFRTVEETQEVAA